MQQRTSTPDEYTPLIKQTLADLRAGLIRPKTFSIIIAAFWKLRNSQ